MVKVNPIRAFALASVVTLPLLAGCGRNNNTGTNNVNQTEVVIEGVSDAIKAPVYSTERNTTLDDKVRSFATDIDDLNGTNDNMAITYNNVGTFGAAAELQKYIDEECIKRVWSNLDLDSLRDTDEATVGYLRYTWDDMYYHYLNDRDKADKTLYENGMLSAEDVISFYDKLFSEMVSSKIKKAYFARVKEYESQQKNPNSVESLSNAVAFRIYTMDMLEYEIIMKAMATKSVSVLEDKNNYIAFQDVFKREFVQYAKPAQN